MALPAILPPVIILTMSPADFRAFPCPTIPCELSLGSSLSSRPSPRICECAPVETYPLSTVANNTASERTDPLHLRNVAQLRGTGRNLSRLYAMSTFHILQQLEL